MELLEMPLDQLRVKHGIDAQKVEHYLHQLETVGLIERKGSFGYQFKFEGRLVSWNPNGEFARTHNRRIAIHLMDRLYGNPRAPGTLRTRASVRLIPETRDELIQRLEALSAEMAARGRREMSVYDSSRLIDVTWVLGVQEFDVWEFLMGDMKL